MRWFRWAVMATFSAATGFVSLLALEGLLRPLSTVAFSDYQIVMMVALFLSYIAAVGIYGYLSRRFDPTARRDNETRCRMCSYILRGLTEPRCSECGEAI